MSSEQEHTDIDQAVSQTKKRFDLGSVKLFFTRLALSIKHHPWWSALVILGSIGACKLCVYFAGTVIFGGIICATLPKEQEQP